MRYGSRLAVLAATALVACGGDDTIAGGFDAGIDATATSGHDASGTVTPDADGGEAATGAPALSLDRSSVDFGAVPCGGAAPAGQSLVVTNPGGAALAVVASLASGAVFSITSPTAFNVAPGGSTTITLGVQPVPASATAGATFADSLTLATSDPAQANVSVPLRATASGATLAVLPGVAAFGQQPLSAAATPVPMTLVNTGTAPITLSFGAPSDPQFGLAYTGGPAPVTLAAGAALAGLQATFTPARAVPVTATAPIVALPGTAVCGASATSVAFSGEGSLASATVAPGALDFGAVPCGSLASAKSVTVTNAGTVPFSITGATLAKGASSPYSASSSSSPIAPGTSLDVIVMPRTVPSVSAVPGDYGDTLSITTSLPGDAPHLVTLAEAASGAILQVDTSAVPFGGVPVGTTQTSVFNVTNLGTTPATVTLTASGAPFGVAPAGPIALAGGVKQGATAIFSPTASKTSTGSIGLAVAPGAVLCQPLPGSITLSGTGETGSVSTSASSLSFGNVPCGKTAPAQTFTVSNTGNAPLTWKAALGKASSPYAIAPATATLAPGASSVITVTPGAIPAASGLTTDLYADAITITSDALGDPAHVVALHESATGAILAFAPTQVHFGSVPVSTTASGSFQIVNTGNAPATVKLVSSNGAFGVPAGTTLVAAGGSATVGATFAPGASTALQSASATPSVATTDALCAPLPSPELLDGTGTKGTVALAPTSLDFQNVSCGTAAGAKQITFTNAGNQDYTITALTLGLGASSKFTVAMSPASGIVPKNGVGSVVVTVSPKAIPVPSAVGTGLYSDTLTITTNASGDTAHPVALTMGAKGVLLSAPTTGIPFGSVPIGATATTALSVTNSGNVATAVNFSGITSAVFSFDQGLVAQPAASIAPNAYFTPTAAQGYSATAAIAVPVGTALCSALPGTISLSGTGTSTSTVSVAPTTVSFGNVSCGAAAPAAHAVTVKNLANKAATFSATLQSGTWYTISTVPAGATTVAAGATVTVNVAAKAIPVAFTTQVGAAAYADNLVVQVGASTTSVALGMTAQGAILQFNPAAINVNRGATFPFNVVNSGNQSTGITLTSDNALFVPSPASGGATIGSSSWSVKNNATTAQTAHFTMALQAGGVICQPLPKPFLVNGN